MNGCISILSEQNITYNILIEKKKTQNDKIIVTQAPESQIKEFI